jgi:hypothetical protein
METPPPPPLSGAPAPSGIPVEKKRGLGCFGWGCFILVVLVILLAALVGGISYWTYGKVTKLTSPTAGTVQSFDGGNDLYAAATKKLTDFDQALQQQQPATLQLNADEINTLIARDHDFADNDIHVFVTLTDAKADLQLSIPTTALPAGLLKGRYVNGDASLGLNFDPESKTIDFAFYSLRLGDQEVPNDLLSTLQGELGPALNQALQGDPECKKILDQAKSIEVKNGLLTIEIQ